MAVGTEVDTNRCLVGRLAVVMPPFETTTDFEVIVDSIEQVLIQSDVVISSATIRSDTDQVALDDVVPIVREGIVGHNAMTIAVVASSTKVANCRNVRQRQLVRNRMADAAKEVRATLELIETRVPTKRPSSVYRRVFRGIDRCQNTGMGEWFRVVHRVCVTVEEVVGSGDDFVANSREEVTEDHRDVFVCQFKVELRNRPSEGAEIESILEIPRARCVAKSLCVLSVNTVD